MRGIRGGRGVVGRGGITDGRCVWDVTRLGSVGLLLAYGHDTPGLGARRARGGINGEYSVIKRVRHSHLELVDEW